MPIEIISVRDETDDVFTDTTWASVLTASSAITSGSDFLVIATANTSTNDFSDRTTELEFRYGSTRLGYIISANQFGQFNQDDSAKGIVGRCLARVAGDGSSTINLRSQVESGSGAEGIAGNLEGVAINLDDLGTEDTDWFWSETANSDSANISLSGTTELRADDTATSETAAQDGEIQVTPGTTEDWLVIGYAEVFFDSGAATTDDIFGELQLVEDPSGSPSTTVLGPGEPFSVEADESDAPEETSKTWIFGDVVELTSGTVSRFQMVFSGDAGNANGYVRRIRMFAAPLSSFADSAYITDAGNIQANSATVEGTSDLDFDFGASTHDAVVMMFGATSNGGTWANDGIVEDPDGTPTYYPDGDTTGRFEGGHSAGAVACCFHLAVLEDIADDYTFRVSATGDTAEHRVGRNGADSAGVRTVLLALMMDTPASGSDGDGAVTNGADTLSAAGSVENVGAGAATSGDDTTVGAGTAPAVGTSAISEGADTLSAAGEVENVGTGAITSGDDTAAGVGTSSSDGAGAVTNSDDTAAGSGTVPAVGTAAISEGADTLVGEGTSSAGSVGDGAITNAADTAVGAGTVELEATGAATSSDDTLAATGTAPAIGTGAVTNADDTLAGGDPAEVSLSPIIATHVRVTTSAVHVSTTTAATHVASTTEAIHG